PGGPPLRAGSCGRRAPRPERLAGVVGRRGRVRAPRRRGRLERQRTSKVSCDSSAAISYAIDVNAAALLRRERRRAGMSQRVLAQAAGVPQSTVARIELAQLSPRVDTLERLLRATGQTLSSERVLGIGVDRSPIRELLR